MEIYTSGKKIRRLNKIDVDDSKIMSNRHRSVSEAQLMTKYQEVILLQQEKIKELEFKVNTYFISSIY